MTSLIDRIEAATGPDRNLDYSIFCAVAIPNHKHKWDPKDNNHRYTKSLDAALTLVPENETLQLTRHGGGWVAEVCCEDETSRMVSLDSAALALCAAALRARGVM